MKITSRTDLPPLGNTNRYFLEYLFKRYVEEFQLAIDLYCEEYTNIVDLSNIEPESRPTVVAMLDDVCYDYSLQYHISNELDVLATYECGLQTKEGIPYEEYALAAIS